MGTGVFALPMISLYGASKFALEGFSESLSYELSGLGISVKSVEPGGVVSEYLAFMRAGRSAAAGRGCKPSAGPGPPGPRRGEMATECEMEFPPPWTGSRMASGKLAAAASAPIDFEWQRRVLLG